MTNTPNFDKALNKILKDLRPLEKICKECKEKFRIEQGDIDFYKMVRVPPPTHCPLCRLKRRLSHHIRMPRFFKKESAMKDKKKILTIFPPETKHKIYDFHYWHGDNWDAIEYAREYDESKPFFEEFKNLFFSIPHLPMERDPKGTNTDYSLGGLKTSSVYFSGGAVESEDLTYCYEIRYSRNLIDCHNTRDSELCYESIGSDHCSKCQHITECSNCLESLFLFDCKNCQNCFLSANLRNKSYIFENKQLSKKEYEKKIKNIGLGKRSIRNEYIQKFQKLIQESTHRATKNINVENCVGDYLTNCKNCYFTFRSENSENARFSTIFARAKNVMDVVGTISEYTYEITSGTAHNTKFCLQVREGTFLEYCIECYNCHNCFGCIGLKNKQFHIFNKPYEESEYYKKVDSIKTKMLEREEYGEFFPTKLGLMPHQGSSSQLYFPITKKEAMEKEIPWYEEPESEIPEKMQQLQAPNEIPENIQDIDNSILEKAIICEITKKPFRITKNELAFYRKMNIPIPTIHPFKRILKRAAQDHNLWLFPFACPKCSKKTWSVYPPEKQKKLNILCEACYLKEIN